MRFIRLQCAWLAALAVFGTARAQDPDDLAARDVLLEEVASGGARGIAPYPALSPEGRGQGDQRR